MAERFPTAKESEECLYRGDVTAQDNGDRRMAMERSSPEAVITPLPINDAFSILSGGDIDEIAGVEATELTSLEASGQTTGGLVIRIYSAPCRSCMARNGHLEHGKSVL